MQDVLDMDRAARLRQEKGKAVVRGLHSSELEGAGAARSAALREADAQLDRIARLLPDALQSGLTLAEVARLTGVSRPTLYELRGRYGSIGDVRLAILQVLASRPRVATRDLATIVGREWRELRPVVDQFV